MFVSSLVGRVATIEFALTYAWPFAILGGVGTMYAFGFPIVRNWLIPKRPLTAWAAFAAPIKMTVSFLSLIAMGLGGLFAGWIIGAALVISVSYLAIPVLICAATVALVLGVTYFFIRHHKNC